MQAVQATPTAQPTTIISVAHVWKRYRNVNALSDFNLEVPRGSIFGLIGPNGAGKTTLLRILAALLPASTGQVWIENQEVSKSPAIIQRKIGYMPDFFGVYPDLTATEYLDFYAGIHGIPRKQRPQLIRDLLELVDLSSKSDAMVESLSRGMKQRLCLARALVHDPEVLLLDEPASGLDPRARIELRDLLRTLQGMGKTVIISSHILLELAEMCSDVAIVQKGHVVVAGSIEQVSRRVNGGRQLEVRVLDRMPETIAALKELPTITDVQEVTNGDGAFIQADFTGDDSVLQQTLASLIARGLPVISFAPRSGRGRLEEVFMNITEGSSQS